MRDQGVNIVIVDDNPVLLSVLAEIFRECGHSVRVASDGFMALAEIRSRVPDILLSDLSMPRMSGCELLSVVRRRFPAVRVIAMSGAYTGAGIPPGVAADAFYAKGESSVAQLIQMVRTIWREETQFLRSTAPVWVSEISLDQVGAPVLLASCPECLRPFPHCLAEIGIQQRETCPHCMVPFEFLIVRPSATINGTPISICLASLQRSTLMPGDAPMVRMFQQ